MSVRLGCVTLVLALFAVSAEAQVWGYVSQSFSLVRSDILEAAEYTMLANITSRDAGENYEERLYPASKWACTARTVPKTESSPTRAMFLDLFRYFAGDNADKKEIDLTVPVNTYVQQRDNDVTYYETCLVLPAKFQSSPPKANNPSVFLEDKPEQVILTRRVSGYFVTDNAWEEEAISLKKVLKEKEPEADYSGYYRNGYDAPMRIFNRRNEVWYRKTGDAAKKAIEDYKKRQAEKVVVPAAAAPVEDEKKKPVDEKKPVVDEKKPAADEKKPASDEKKPAAAAAATNEKKVDEKKPAEPAQNRE